MKKQKIIARWLKGLCALLAVMGVVFFGGLTVFLLNPENVGYTDSYHIRILFSWLIAVFCYFILFQFLGVCHEIEKDNSFSLENAKYFRNMAVTGILMGISYIVRLVYLFIITSEGMPGKIFAFAMIFVCACFVVICECLSQLIKNAYEIQLENELTI